MQKFAPGEIVFKSNGHEFVRGTFIRQVNGQNAIVNFNGDCRTVATVHLRTKAQLRRSSV